MSYKWVQIDTDIDGEAARDQSGGSVSLNSTGNVVAIGAYLNDGNGTSSGHVRVYKYENGGWIQLGADIDGEDGVDWSGWSVSLNSAGNVVAIGADLNDGNGTYSGHVRVYKYENGGWIKLGADIDGEADSDQSGWSVSLNSTGNVVAIGAPFNDGNDGNGDNSGHVRVYGLIKN